jgi:hypothetical protein
MRYWLAPTEGKILLRENLFFVGFKKRPTVSSYKDEIKTQQKKVLKQKIWNDGVIGF